MENKIKELEEKLLRKEQECERLKHDNGYEVGALEKTIDNLKAENEKLRQALADIKEIAEKVYNDCDDCYRDTNTNCEVDCINCTIRG